MVRSTSHQGSQKAGGFVWQGTTYPSLSTIARAITGTAWNGPRSFGLRVATERDGEKSDSHPDPGVTTGSLSRRPTRRRLADARGGYSVRGFLAGVVRKRLGLTLVSEKTGTQRVYRIVAERASRKGKSSRKAG